MCGRYTLTIDKSTIEKRFGAKFYIAHAEYEPTFNAAASQMLPIITTQATSASSQLELRNWLNLKSHFLNRRSNAGTSERTARRA